MTDLFIDTDVIIDFIIDRQPFSREAALVFTLIDQKKVKGYTSALCYSNLYYVLSKYASHKKVITMLNELSELVRILKVDNDIIKALKDSIEMRDLSDKYKIFVLIHFISMIVLLIIEYLFPNIIISYETNIIRLFDVGSTLIVISFLLFCNRLCLSFEGGKEVKG